MLECVESDEPGICRKETMLTFDDRREVDDERHRPQEPKPQQEFYAGVRSAPHTRFAVHRPRELTHDSQVYRA